MNLPSLRAVETRRLMLWVAVACQLAAVAITWNLWQVRDDPINLPAIANLASIPFGWAMVASLLLAGLVPRWGVPLHWVVLGTACVWDQFRLEPQFIGVAVLMLVWYGESGQNINRWYLVAMWLWTGIHKLLSQDWTGYVSWQMVEATGLPAERIHLPLAIAIAITEISLGVFAWLRPTVAAKICVALHLGIVVVMSPWVANMNHSVIPWNLGLAVIGYWILGSARAEGFKRFGNLANWEKLIAVTLLVVPAGFYLGWVDRCFSHVMYSGKLPRGLITNDDELIGFDGYQGLGVPFPHERRIFRQYFELTAKPGDKLHVADPRRLLADQYFELRNDGAWLIEPEQFFERNGVAIDDKQSQFVLAQAGVRMLKQSAEAMVYAVAFSPQNYDRALLKQLAGLPNLRQIELSGTDVDDEAMAELADHYQLEAIGLNDTQVTDRGIALLDRLPKLFWVGSEGTSITSDELR